MTDRPILFSAPMVRALIAGRKTQTRRIFKGIEETADGKFHLFNAGGGLLGVTEKDVAECGPDYVRVQIGDYLWVRESWKPHSTFDHLPPREIPESNVFYLADDKYSPSGSRGRPGIHMPRWASRLTLTVTDVRVERLQDITLRDAFAEGCAIRQIDLFGAEGEQRNAIGRAYYRSVWEEINGAGSWNANPWVVAYTFTVQHGNIDQIEREAA